MKADESFDTNYGSTAVHHVELSTKLEELYNALFIETYDKQIYERTIGSLSFDRRTKKLLDKAANLLSSYAIFDYI